MTLSNSSRFFLALGLVALCFQSAFAHTYLSTVILDNNKLSEGDCVRPHPRTAFDSPIPLVTSPDMTCGWLPEANNAANRKCPIAAGSTIGIQWHHNSNSPSDDIVDSTHVGPVIFYLAKSDTGAGDVWFKIYEDGYANGKWAVDRLLENRGRVDVKIPSDIAPGNYLLRGEIIALHGAYALNGVQPYVGCVELTISGSGTANPSGVSFPGYYKNTDPGMLMSVYQPFSRYIIPGPALYVPSSSTGSPSTPTSAPSTSAPTTKPTTAPTTAPTTRPTTAPTTAPTTRPTTAPTQPGVETIKVTLDGGSNVWWVGVRVSGGSETTVKVEIKGTGSTTWVALTDMSYAYTTQFSTPVEFPVSLRLTSSNGKQVTLENIFTSLSQANKVVDTGSSYSNPSTPAPTTPATQAPTVPATQAPTRPATQAPTTPATQAPTTPPSSGSAKVTLNQGASEWWFALTVSGVDAAKVEIKDSGYHTSFKAMTKNVWGPQEVYTFDAQGVKLVAPVTIQITSKANKVETVSVTRFASGAVFEASS